MAMFVIGGVRLELHPLNVNEVDHDNGSDFAKHQVLGARPAYEFMGPGEEKLSFKGDVFPRAIGGMAELALLKSLQADGQAIMVTRGNALMGWFRITRLKEGHTHLSEDGVGRKVAIQIDIERDERPTGSGAVSGLLTRLFGYA